MTSKRPAPPGKGGRILVVSQHFWPENFRVNDLVAGLLEAGLDVDVLCGLPNYPKGEWFPGYRYTGPRRGQYAGAQLYRAGEIRRKGNSALRIFLNYVSFPFFALFSLPRLPGGYSAVLCYETSPVLQLLPAIVYAKAKRLPLTGYVLDLWPDNLYSVLKVRSAFLRRVAYAASRWHYRRCARLIALGDAHAETLREMTKGAKRPPAIAVVPQYAEDFYAEDAEDPALAGQFAGRFTILFTGNLSPAQDLDTLIRAMRRVREAPEGQDVQALLLGDGMSRDDLEAAVKAAGLEDAVRFCGQHPAADIPKWTHCADALFAGLAESENLALTLPAKIPAYLAAGRPLLLATGGEAARVAGGCGAALTSPPGSDAALAENILALRAMPEEKRREMGEAGRACWRQNYRREALLKQLIDFVLTGKGAL